MEAEPRLMRFWPFELQEVLDEVRAVDFPHLAGVITGEFSRERASVAWVTAHPSPGVLGRICLSIALDRDDTPLEAIRAILQHEVLHLDVPPGATEPLLDHTVEFFMREFEVAAAVSPTWEWLRRTFGRRLRGEAGITVLKGRRVRKGGRRLPGRASVARLRDQSMAPATGMGGGARPGEHVWETCTSRPFGGRAPGRGIFKRQRKGRAYVR